MNESIDQIMKQTLDNLKYITDSQTVVGKPVTTDDGTVVLPVSKVSLGFVTGGGEYSDTVPKRGGEYPHAAITGGGVTVSPMGFLLCGREKRFISLENTTENKWGELAKSLVRTLKKDD